MKYKSSLLKNSLSQYYLIIRYTDIYYISTDMKTELLRFPTYFLLLCS